MQPTAIRFLAHEAEALLGRLDSVRPFALTESMPPAAALSLRAQRDLDRYFASGRIALRGRIERFRDWLAHSEGSSPELAQRRFTSLRLQFNRVLTQFDLFSDALSQRSERDTGVWLAGLDALARDALELPGHYEAPPLICYLDRGIGAAIRRARTRLPGGGDNPVALIRVPRERMIGTGVASSLVHEVGHQAAALLDLVVSLRRALADRIREATGQAAVAWRCFERWISEIVADFWSVGRVGIASTLGLIGVVSLPRAFVFRVSAEDPHPFPWIRIKLSCAVGQQLFPGPQWRRTERLWEDFYPVEGAGSAAVSLISALEGSIPEFAEMLATHRPPVLRGMALGEALVPAARSPEVLRRLRRRWIVDPSKMRTAPPTVVLAALGQARFDGQLSPRAERRALSRMFEFWAVAGALGATTRPGPATGRPIKETIEALSERKA